MPNPNIICIEGPDGVGKSTRIAHLKQVFEGRMDVLFTKEPGGSILDLRRLLFAHPEFSPLTQMNVAMVDRLLHINDKIIPALRENKKIVVDRFFPSTKVYNAPSHDAFLVEMYKKWLAELPPEGIPQTFIYLTCAPEVAKQRALSGEVNHFDIVDLEVFEARRAAYEECFTTPGLLPEGCAVKRVDTSGSIEESNLGVEQIVRECFGW